MENSDSVSIFDTLRRRLNMPNPWTLTEAPPVSKPRISPRTITRTEPLTPTEVPALSKPLISPRRSNRRFRQLLVGMGLSSAATTVRPFRLAD